MTTIVDPVNIHVNTDSVVGEWAFYQDTCIQQAVRQYTIKWFPTSGWTPDNHGWTSTPFLQSPYHYTWIENSANFTNTLFCDPSVDTYARYPHVRIIGFDDASVSFFDDAYAVGDCDFLLHKEWTHYFLAVEAQTIGVRRVLEPRAGRVPLILAFVVASVASAAWYPATKAPTLWFPVFAGILPFAAATARQGQLLRWTAAACLLLWAFLAALSVGPFYLPAVILMFAAAGMAGKPQPGG